MGYGRPHKLIKENKDMLYTHNLSGKTAVVTGGGGVLCSAFAKALCEHGAKVAVIDINQEAASLAANAAGPNAVAVTADCLDAESLNNAKDKIEKMFGKVDILINGAGGNSPRGTTADEFFDESCHPNLFDLDAAALKFVSDLNFLAPLLTTQAFAPLLLKDGGNILNISSMNAFRPLTKIPAYSAAKAALSNLTQWLAVYFAKSGIRVNAIAPGFFETNQNKELLRNKDGSLTERSKKILANTPMARFGTPDELLGTLIWLVDDNSSAFVTGIVVPVDGGFSAYSGV